MAKLISASQLKGIKKNQKSKSIGLCHGAFDILHNGHLEHFNEAKKKVDVLVVSLTGDKFIQKGPNQPYNNETNRSKFLLNIRNIDYVYIDHNITALDVIKKLKPNFYFKGKDYNEKDITNNLNKEVGVLEKNKGKLIITNTKLQSSTRILNNMEKTSEGQVDNFLRKISKNKGFEEIFKATEKVKNMEINLIGEPIIDNYIFCKMTGLTTKDPAISSVVEKIKSIPGGVVAVAKVLSMFAKKINLYTFGSNKDLFKYFKGYKNIKLYNLDKTQRIQTKTRYINSNRFEKLFQITNFKKNYFSTTTSKKITKIIKKFKNNIIVCDFGLGLFEGEILEKLENNKLRKYLNVQSNSINFGYNLFTKYKNFDYLSLDEREWKLGFGTTEKVDLSGYIKKLKKNKFFSCALTKGKRGSEYYINTSKFSSPVFIKNTTDTTGCGDAFFAITSLMIKSKLNPSLIPFVGNVYAGMHSQYFGNEIITSKIKFLKYIKSMLKR